MELDPDPVHLVGQPIELLALLTAPPEGWRAGGMAGVLFDEVAQIAGITHGGGGRAGDEGLAQFGIDVRADAVRQRRRLAGPSGRHGGISPPWRLKGKQVLLRPRAE